MKSTDLKIESINDVNKGGQHVGVISTGVKVTHLPTGLVASCSVERSQLQNVNVAKLMIEYGLAEIGWF